MNLVAYSDSEGSGSDSAPQVDKSAIKSTSKSTFQKVVDSSNPRKIRVNLPSDRPNNVTEESKRPAKRPRTGGSGLFGGLSSFLPAPKHSGEAAPNAAPSKAETPGKGAGTGIGNRVNLKTGAAPGFSRDTPQSVAELRDDSQPHSRSSGPVIATTIDADEVKLVGKATMFRPLSVAKKSQKKKKPISTTSSASASANASKPIQELKPVEMTKPKVSLFSMNQDDDNGPPPINLRDEPPEVLGGSDEDESFELQQQQNPNAPHTNLAPQAGSETLHTIASDLNLDEATKRQLFGRRGRGNDIPVNLLNFDTDKEYAANEELRATGETIQHNPLRAIQPGKHSLKQLVNAATSQKEALEESWATGKRNAREAGNRYGW